jgi:hypothetical protein
LGGKAAVAEAAQKSMKISPRLDTVQATLAQRTRHFSANVLHLIGRPPKFLIFLVTYFLRKRALNGSLFPHCPLSRSFKLEEEKVRKSSKISYLIND